MRRAAVCEKDNREVPRARVRLRLAGLRARRADAVLPVDLVLDNERGEYGAQEVSVEPGVVAPAFGAGVGEDSAVDRGSVGVPKRVVRLGAG